jgi:hypothetical protein
MSLQDDVEAAVTALNVVQTDVTSQEPTLADNVLAAVTPVLEEAGWTAPVPTPDPELPATTE